MGMGGGNLINGGVASVAFFDQDFYLRYGQSIVTGQGMIRKSDNASVSLGRW